MVRRDPYFHVVEADHVIKDSIFNDGVEFMLDTCDHSDGLETVNTHFFPCVTPVEGLEVEKLEFVKDKHHASNDFGLFKMLTFLFVVVFGDRICHWLIPWITAIVPIMWSVIRCM